MVSILSRIPRYSEICFCIRLSKTITVHGHNPSDCTEGAEQPRLYARGAILQSQLQLVIKAHYTCHLYYGRPPIIFPLLARFSSTLVPRGAPPAGDSEGADGKGPWFLLLGLLSSVRCQFRPSSSPIPGLQWLEAQDMAILGKTN